MCVQNIAAKPEEHKLLCRPRCARADNIKEEYSREKFEAVDRAKYKMCVQNIAAKPEEHKLLCRPRHRREKTIKINLRQLQ